MKHIHKLLIFISFQFLLLSCTDWHELSWDLSYLPNNMKFKERLSDYRLFQGEMKNLTPIDGVVEYTLSTELFTDYAEKQRLLKIPNGKSMAATGDGLPIFPDSTILVKTFYYNSNQLSTNEKRIIETRLLFKNNGSWNAAVYEWNDLQTDAVLMENSKKKLIQFRNKINKVTSINYHIPSHSECTTCHNSDNEIVPIGLKLRNINRNIEYANGNINQLEHLINRGLLRIFDKDQIGILPDWEDAELPINKRVRAYLDLNCTHCHNSKGSASNFTNLDFSYDKSLKETGIINLKEHIPARMETEWGDEKMPSLGTTLQHKEAIDLIKLYMNDIK